MAELLQYEFFKNALIGILIISVASAMIGTYIVSRRLVAISGGITHACFGGLGLGYYLGISPIAMAGFFAIAATAGVEWMSANKKIREDSAIAVIWAIGMAIGVVFVFMTPGYVPELNSFLFGNILTVNRNDLWFFTIYTLVLTIFFVLFYRNIIICAFDRDFAKVMNLPVNFITYSMTIFIALGIVLTIRMVGVMLLMSMLTLPQMTAEIYCRRFHTIMFLSIVISLFSCLLGLIAGAYIDVPCSAMIVIVMAIVYITVRLLKRIRPNAFVLLTACVLIMASVSGCSTKKNTAATRNYQAFITRYNVYFNGDEHYKETLKHMESTYEDDYSRLLPMHPAENRGVENAPQPTGSFTRSIEKAQKAIQLRSIKRRPARKPGKRNDPEYKAWLKREEYNPFLHNAWMMMGRSQYMDGDFTGAAATFSYVSKHFKWLPATVTEAKLWQARSYCAMDWLFEAEAILSRTKKEALTNKELQGLYYFTYADYYIKSKDYKEAAPMLQEAIKYTDGPQKTRLTFLLGQIYELLGDNDKAYKAFKEASSAHSASYRARFNARIKESEVYSGNNISGEVKSLQGLTRFDRNREYLDQIYYAIGNLYMSRGDTAKAMSNYVKAVESSTRNGIDKAIAQLALGNIYFNRHKYAEAQPCYSEAVPLLPKSYPGYENIRKRSDVLDELAVYAQNVNLQDSLLRLSSMSPQEQREIIDKIISELKKKEKEEEENAKREAYLEEQRANGNKLNSSGANNPNSFQLNTDKSWYFYNTATRNAGRTEFQKRWGSRKLEDDWRRRNKTTFSFDEFNADDENNDDGVETNSDNNDESESKDEETVRHESDPHYPEYYLKQIPNTDLEKANSNEVIMEGLYNMGVILKDKLEDYVAAESEFDNLLSRYPDNPYRLETYYNLYLMYMRLGETAKAEKYRLLIITDFPESTYGEAMRDPHYLENLRDMNSNQEKLYAKTYEAYIENRNEEVHKAYIEVRDKYPMSPIMPKFMFLEALTYVTENDADKFGETLRELLERYPETDITPVASSYLRGLAQGRKLHSSASNQRGMIWNIRLTNDSIGETPDGESELKFDTISPDTPQLLILTYPTDSVSANQLLFEIARHNFYSFTVKDFDLEQMNFGNLGMLIIKGFDNMNEINHYRKVMESSNELSLPPQVRPIVISPKNFELLLTHGRSFEEYFRAADAAASEATHNKTLPPEEYPSAEEMYDDDVSEQKIDEENDEQ